MSEESIENLCRLGYSDAEARFLRLAAVHSGYFLRRQFDEFTRASGGGAAARFLEKLLRRGHAQIVHFRPDRLIFHIRAQRIYTRFDAADNRNRREKAPLTIRRKLMILDFVLDHRQYRFFAGEEEKLAYLVGLRGVKAEALPVRRYQSRASGESTVRSFVDKLPICVSAELAEVESASGGSCASPIVHFAYIDEGAETIAGFETFLRQHHQLFMALGSFDVVFAAADSALFDKASRAFRRFYPVEGGTTLGELRPEQVRMVEFFRMRRKREQREFKGVGTDGIVAYRSEKEHFAGTAYDELYRTWFTEGDDVFKRRMLSRGNLTAQFRTLLLPHDYEIFGGVTRAS